MYYRLEDVAEMMLLLLMISVRGDCTQLYSPLFVDPTCITQWECHNQVECSAHVFKEISANGCFGRVSDDIMTDSSPLISPTAKISYDEGKVDLYSCTENLNVTWDVLLGRPQTIMMQIKSEKKRYENVVECVQFNISQLSTELLKVGVVFDCLRSLDLSWSIEMRLNTVVRRDKKRSSKHVAAPWTVSTRKLERRSAVKSRCKDINSFSYSFKRRARHADLASQVGGDRHSNGAQKIPRYHMSVNNHEEIIPDEVFSTIQQTSPHVVDISYGYNAVKNQMKVILIVFSALVAVALIILLISCLCLISKTQTSQNVKQSESAALPVHQLHMEYNTEVDPESLTDTTCVSLRDDTYCHSVYGTRDFLNVFGTNDIQQIVRDFNSAYDDNIVDCRMPKAESKDAICSLNL